MQQCACVYKCLFSIDVFVCNSQEENKMLKDLTDASNDGSITPSEGEVHT